MIESEREKNKRSAEDPERRRARNRLSQRVYRRRHAERVRELRERAEAGSMPPNEAFEKLQKENQSLRKQLVDVQSKLTKLNETLKAMVGSITNALDGYLPNESLNQIEEIDPPPEPNTSTTSRCSITSLEPEPLSSTSCSDWAVDSPFRSLSRPVTTVPCPFETSQMAIRPITSTNRLDWEPPSDSMNYSFQPQIPNIWSHEYQMGLQPYARAFSGCENSSLALQKPWVETNSAFSDHIAVLLQLMTTNTRDFESQRNWRELLYRQVVAVLGLFNSLTRPEAMAWYAKTKFHHIVDLTTWQLYPCLETLEKVEEQYRPTLFQLQHEHPRVIDWIPFPSLRDRLIRLHSANPQIDQIFCDVVSSYTVEACLADLVSEEPKTRVYIRVLDVAMGVANMGNKTIDPHTILPAPDAESLFSLPECAQAAFKLLNMDHGVTQYKLDPSFFGTYPELFDPEEDIVARGAPLRPNIQTRLPYPGRLDNLTFQTYRSFMEFHALALAPLQTSTEFI